MTVPPAIELEALLGEERWVRALARRLVQDGNEADDLAQDAWVATLEARRVAPDRRRWLAAVVRNLWLDLRRARGRRARRELAAARPEQVAAHDELVAELELRQRVGRALLELEEPFRRTLTLRFFKDQSLPEIARAEGVALSTVHERIQRGLARLRARLDRDHGGREAWAGVALALARPAVPAGGLLETVAMTSAWKAAAASVAVVLGGGLAWWWVEREGARAAPAPAAGLETAETGSGPSPGTSPAFELERREEALPADAPVAEPSASGAAEPVLVRGRVVTVEGAPAAFVDVGWEKEAAPQGATSGATSGADGAFALAPSSEPEGDRLLCRSPRFVTLVPGSGAVPVVVVGARVDFAGRVVGPSGEPVAGATLALRLRERLFRSLGLVRPAWDDLETRWTTESDAQGRFQLRDLAGGEPLFLAVDATGYLAREVELAPGGALDLVITLEARPREATYTGTVVDPAGQPVEGARVSAGERIVATDAEGRFALAWLGSTGESVQDERGVWRQKGIEAARLIALKPGFAPADVPLRTLDPAQPVVLELGPATLSITGRILDVAGEPRAGIVVWFRDPTRFGSQGETVGDELGSYSSDVMVEALLCGSERGRGTVSAADGRFELGCLMERDYELCAYDAPTAARGGPWIVAAGSRDVRLTFADEPGTTRVAGRVLTLGGEPIAGVEIEPLRSNLASYYDQPPPLPGKTSTVVTDEDGAFEFPALVAPGTTLQLMHERLFFRFVPLARFHDLDEIELREAVLCELQVDLSRQPELADHLQVLDPEGKALDLLVASANVVAWSDQAEIQAGLSNVLRVQETGCTLVLRRGDLEVRRQPLVLDPARRTTVGP